MSKKKKTQPNEVKSVIVKHHSFNADQFFNEQQKQRLSELMHLWKQANEGQSFSKKLQTELDNLVEAELKATTARTAFLLQQPSK